MDDKFDGMYMNHTVKKIGERSKENQIKIEAFKKLRYHITRDSGN